MKNIPLFSLILFSFLTLAGMEPQPLIIKGIFNGMKNHRIVATFFYKNKDRAWREASTIKSFEYLDTSKLEAFGATKCQGFPLISNSTIDLATPQGHYAIYSVFNNVSSRLTPYDPNASEKYVCLKDATHAQITLDENGNLHLVPAP
ncbi:hypothetical protein BH09DEP1_BH09DEP1_8610 [soil metagenome]